MDAKNHGRKPASRRGRLPVVWLLLLLLAVLLPILIRFRSAPPPSQPVSVSTSSSTAPTPNSPEAESNAVFSAYAGSASCRDCHQEEFELWQKSNHGLAERPVSLARDGAAFKPARTVLTGVNQATVSVHDGRFAVATMGLLGTQEVFQVARVIGNDPLRQFLVPFPGGRMQTLEASYDPHRNEWFDSFGNENRKPGEWGHWTGRGMNWNSMCAECHNTRLVKNYDPATDTYQTAKAEMSVGCEACHGPLKAHNEWQAKFGKSGKPDPTVKKLARDQILNYCAFCHTRRTDLTGDFKPGDNFFDDFSPAIVDYSDTFYPDGQNHDEDYEFTAFLGSQMHARGVMCLDCHNPHSMKTILPGNWLCLRCHGGGNPNAPVINPVLHAHHKVFGYDTNGVPVNLNLLAYNPKKVTETGGECVNCHMPQTVYMQRHWRHDHGFTSPDPLLTKEFGIPNACNRCHQDKTADWALEWTKKWYGDKMNRPARVRAQWIARAKTNDVAARDGLLGLLKQEKIPYWRAVEAGMLSPWADDASVSNALMRVLADPDPLARESAVRALGGLVDAGFTDAAEAVRARLDDPVRNVRIAAAWTLRATLDPSLPAARELQHYLTINSDQPAGQLMIGTFDFSRNDPQSALAHLEKAVDWDPYSTPLREELAVVLGALNRPQEAVEQLKIASRQAPRDAEIHFKLGLACNETGDVKDTLAELSTAAQLAPQNARIWYNLGLAQNQAGQTASALESLARAESADASDPSIPYAEATILARLGRVAEARAAAKRALAIAPDYAAARQLLELLPE